jgi:hypothetical protein
LRLGGLQHRGVRVERVADHEVGLVELVDLGGELAELLTEGVAGLADPGEDGAVALQ